MRVLENLKIDEYAKLQRIIFESLPDRGKELIFESLRQLSIENVESLKHFLLFGMSDYTACQSPIEKILYAAIDIAYAIRSGEFGTWFFDLTPQYEIVENRRYRADFLLSLMLSNEMCEEFYYIIIECDGHDFHHKTKEQVERDNERDMRIKMFGYDVLRFSGSQIYKNPMKCANDILDFALLKIREEEGN